MLFSVSGRNLMSVSSWGESAGAVIHTFLWVSHADAEGAWSPSVTLSGAAVVPTWHLLAHRALLQLLGDVGIASLFFPLDSLTLPTIQQVFAKVSVVLAANHEQIFILLGQGCFKTQRMLPNLCFSTGICKWIFMCTRKCRSAFQETSRANAWHGLCEFYSLKSVFQSSNKHGCMIGTFWN